MPDLLTHAAFGEDVLQKIKSNQLKDILNQNKTLFLVGNQGPDIFFYYNFFRKKKTRIGHKMHRMHTGDFLIQSCETIMDIEYELHYNQLISYIMGFICHYVLDKNAHPFVYNYSGYSFEKGEEKGIYDFEHAVIETCIDVYMWKKIKNREAYKERAYQLIDLKKPLPKSVTQHLRTSICTLYGVNIEDKEINKAYRHFVWAWKLLYDPHDIKKRVISLLSRIKGKPIGLPKPLYPKDIDICKPFLNLEKNTWSHPFDANFRFNDSFEEIYDLALDECSEMIQKLYINIKERERINPNIIGNKSYLSNLTWDSAQNLATIESKGFTTKGGKQ